jgi:hypothetical protein
VILSSREVALTDLRRLRLLSVISAAHLSLAGVGMRKALRDRTPADVGFMRGSPETMKRDLWFMGTNLSAPPHMLVMQALATVLLMTRHGSGAAKTLGILGAMNSLGYPAEKSVRRAWRHPDRSVAPLAAVLELLSIAMAWLGLRPSRR